jgi:putative peptide zinc metalloprotease protein
VGEETRVTALEGAPRLRAGVTLVPRPAQAGGGVIVADREGRRHFRVGDVEGRLLQLLNGTRSLARVHARLAIDFPEAELSPETIAGFARQLEELGLLEGSTLPPRRRLTTSGLMNLQVPLGNPEQFFQTVVQRCPFLFTPAFWAAASLLIVTALWVASGSWEELRQDGFHFHSLPGLLLVWGSLSVITAIHEMGHGLTCTYFGAPATRWGLLLIYLVLPCAYCDVSAAWTLPKKSQRLAVGAAGLAFQWVAGAAALLLWRVVEPGTVVARSLATMAETCGLASLLNLWPFLRLDGYYLLSDLLEVPNLRPRSVARVKARLREFLLGSPERPRGEGLAGNPREERILTYYGAGVLFWSVVMLWIVWHRLAHLFVGWWGGLLALSLGVALLLTRSGWLERWTAGKERLPREENRVNGTKKRRRGVLPPLAIGIGALLLLGRWELNVSSPCRLEAARRVPVTAGTDGVLGEFRYREGDRIHRGALLGTLETFETRQQLTELEARLRMVRAERQAIETRVPVVAAQTEQYTAETRAGLERARTDLTELAEDLPQRVREAVSRTAQAAADATKAAADLQEARAAVEAQARISARRDADLARALVHDYPPAIAALDERVRKCRADRELAARDRDRASVLVSQGALAAQALDRAAAAAEARSREEEAARGDLEDGLKQLREAAEDATAELVRRRATLRSAAAAVAAANASRDAAHRAERRVRAQCRPEQLTSAQRQVEARASALTAAVARHGEVDARRQEIAAKRLDAERLAAQIAVLRRRLRRSALISPVEGVLTTPHVEERIGRHFNKGDPICVLEKPALMSAHIFVPEKEMGAVFVGAPVYLKVAPFPERTFTGQVAEIEPLAQRRGDEIDCVVRLRIPNPHGDLRAGMTGWAKIACGQQPIIALLTRRLIRYARTEAWSWF